MKNLIHISQSSGPRFDLALDQLENGLGFVFQEVWFHKDSDGLKCEAVSPVSSESLTEARVLEVLEQAKAVFRSLRASSDKFRSVTEHLTTRFSVIEDYGMGTTLVAELVGHKLVWH